MVDNVFELTNHLSVRSLLSLGRNGLGVSSHLLVCQ